MRTADSSGGTFKGAATSPMKPSTGSSGQSTEPDVVTPGLAGSSRTACTSRMLLELRHKLEGRSPSAGTPDVRIERCTNSYAQAFSPPSGGEQYFLQYLNGSWQVVAEGTGAGLR